MAIFLTFGILDPAKPSAKSSGLFRSEACGSIDKGLLALGNGFFVRCEIFTKLFNERLPELDGISLFGQTDINLLCELIVPSWIIEPAAQAIPAES